MYYLWKNVESLVGIRPKVGDTIEFNYRKMLRTGTVVAVSVTETIFAVETTVRGRIKTPRIRLHQFIRIVKEAQTAG